MHRFLTAEDASRLARIALGHVTREYPSRLDHVLRSDADVRPPRDLHPAFHGSFDWHSCVEAHWMLGRLLRRFPSIAEASSIAAIFDAHLTPARIGAETTYASDPANAAFERPYGWAWLLALAAELGRHPGDDGRRRSAALQPLADVFVGRFSTYLPKATYPTRSGTHQSSAFALAVAHDYALASGRSDLERLVAEKAHDWYASDADVQAWEPSGEDFLSPALVEAVCMQRVLDPERFAGWFERFLPRLARGEPQSLLVPATVSDRTDPRLVHLDGLNLSRAWCLRLLANGVRDRPLGQLLRDSAEAHLDASLGHVADHYAGEHWLAAYAALALDVAAG